MHKDLRLFQVFLRLVILLRLRQYSIVCKLNLQGKGRHCYLLALLKSISYHCKDPSKRSPGWVNYYTCLIYRKSSWFHSLKIICIMGKAVKMLTWDWVNSISHEISYSFRMNFFFLLFQNSAFKQWFFCNVDFGVWKGQEDCWSKAGRLLRKKIIMMIGKWVNAFESQGAATEALAQGGKRGFSAGV